MKHASGASYALLKCDGSAKDREKGPSGCGGVLYASDADGKQGRLLGHFSRHLGRVTCNQAEYHGLIDGLNKALDFGVEYIHVRMDSQLVVNQINGEYACDARRLVPLHQQATGLLDQFCDWRVHHFPRKENCEADRLARQAREQPPPAQAERCWQQAEAASAPAYATPAPSRSRVYWSSSESESDSDSESSSSESDSEDERRARKRASDRRKRKAKRKRSSSRSSSSSSDSDSSDSSSSESESDSDEERKRRHKKRKRSREAQRKRKQKGKRKMKAHKSSDSDSSSSDDSSQSESQDEKKKRKKKRTRDRSRLRA